MSTVLVTGGTGFIAGHCLLQLLAQGHTVRTTVRNPGREKDVRAQVAVGGGDPEAPLQFFAADLEQDTGWDDAVRGCEYVLHVASPFPRTIPNNEEEVVRPAREGALRVLRAAARAGVKRVVLTSSFAAVGYGHPRASQPFDETSWTDPAGDDVTPYVKSKTLAERAAWDFVASAEGRGLELVAVNPVGVFGPLLGKDYSTSILIVQRLLDGQVPGLPKLHFGVVDVRDVADLHLRAMTDPAANGERFLAVSGDFMTFKEIAAVLKTLGPAARRVPSKELPNALVRLAALFDPSVKQILPELGKPKNATAAKAERVLGWKPRPREEAILASAESMIRLALTKR